MTSANMHTRNRQAGQTTTIVALALGLFLLGVAGLAVDVTNWVFHRQMAQGAADAACTAGVMDLVSSASSGGTSFGNFPAGSPPASFLCSASSTTAACQYASYNGYSAPGLLANQVSNDVKISFPSSAAGLQTCSSTVPPPCIPPTTTVANPFILVNVFDRVPTTFTGIITGNRTADVSASAVCAVINSTAPVPIIVLNPSCPHAFELSGNSTVKIIGGPTRSVEVNSKYSTSPSCAAATSGSSNQCDSTGPAIDLSKGGPSFTGSDFAVVGLPKTAPTGFNGGTSGNWTGGGPISDPYQLVPAPTRPGTASTTDLSSVGNPLNSNPNYVAYNTDGCPDHSGCLEYQPGLYTHPIIVKGHTDIFVPGIYYIEGTNNDNSGSPGAGCLASNVTGQTRYGLDVDSTGVLRPSTATGDGSSGVVFYLSGSGGAGHYGSVFFGSNAGKYGGRTVDQYATSSAHCPGDTSSFPGQLGIPANVDGNVLLGQCTNKGTYIGGGSTDTSGIIRGLLMFQDRRNA